MWFATQDGLNRYDGKEFKYYQYQFEDVTRSTHSKLGEIYVDNNGDIWIITLSGVLQKQVKESYNFQVTKNINNASIIFNSKNDDFYVGTYGGGIYKFAKTMSDTINLLNNKDLTVYEFIDYKNGVLAATSNGVLQLHKDTSHKLITYNNKYISFSAITNRRNKDVFIGSYGQGVFYLNYGSESIKPFKGFGEKQILPDNLIVEDLLVDSKGNLWIATYGDGAYFVNFKNQTINHFLANKNDPYALHFNDVLKIFEDKTGVVWLGTDGSGVHYYDEYLLKFNVLTNKQTPKEVNIDFIRAITEKDGKIWIGTSNKGLTLLTEGKQGLKTFSTSNSGLNSNRIMSLLSYDNKLWIGHMFDGLEVMDNNYNFKFIDALKGQSIWKILEAGKNLLWLCTSEGLILFDITSGIKKKYNSLNSALLDNEVKTIEPGAKDEFWIGTFSKGLYKLNHRTNRIDSITAINDNIKSLFYKDKILWVGTNGSGLKSYNTVTEQVNHYTVNDGLANNVIYGILSDKENNLWLSSNKGLSRVKIVNGNVISIDNFGNYDGLQTNEFNTGAYFKSSDGNLFFGGLEGLNWFKPEELGYNPIKPKTIITDIKIFNKSRKLDKNLQLKHNENTVTFSFSSLHFSQPERNQFKYRLKNNGDDWNDAGNSNIAHYTNLPPNDYEFQVISSNYDGIWNNTPTTYNFTILKPWYLTNTLKSTYILLFLLLIFGIYRYLKFRWNVKTQLQLEHAETERLKKLDEFKTKLYTNISHEFRTPLTLISGPIDHQLSKEDIKPEDKRELNMVKQNANRLLNLVNQMVDLAIIDSGQAQLKVENGNLKILLKQIVDAFQYKAKEKQITISSKIVNLENSWYDIDVIEKIVSNLFSNAVKYAPLSSDIIFDANEQEGNVVFSIINTNKEITKKDLGKLFQRFYQDNTASEGVGVGLALVKELVALAKGSVLVNSIDNDKIQFTVTIPIQKEAFKNFELKHIDNTNNETFSLNLSNSKDSPLLLIVEDDAEIREFISSVFEEEYQIIEANNGQKGIENALTHIPDLIISDIMMPIENGITLCNTLKNDKLTSHIPIILLTAKAGEKNEIDGLKTGADAYITKPFSSEKLKLRVKKLIENRNELQKRFSKDFRINPEIPITSTETEFLKRLKSLVDKEITNPAFTSEDFAKSMGMSRTQLHRKLKAIAGVSTSEFIRIQRLKLAKDLLKKSDATISEIAYQVGFNTPSYFIKCFKEVYNYTPSDYLENN